MRHGHLHNGWADDALKSRAMFLCFAERLARAEESTSALRFIGSQRRTGCEQYESVLEDDMRCPDPYRQKNARVPFREQKPL